MILAFALASCTYINAASRLPSVIKSQSDPELVDSALPVLLLANESIYEADPKNEASAISFASLLVTYANSFVAAPLLIPDSVATVTRDKISNRATRMYAKAMGVMVKAFEQRAHKALGMVTDKDFGGFQKKDVPLLFWTASSILALVTMDTTNFEATQYIGQTQAMLEKAAQLDPAWSSGLVFEILITYYANIPESIGGGIEKARASYVKALHYSQGSSASLYVTYAMAIPIAEENYSEFKIALNKALAFDIEKFPENRLSNVLAQRKARILLSHSSELFTSTQE